MSVEKKVGLFFLLTLIALGGMIEMVEDWHPFEKHVEYRSYFASVVGLNPGDPVRMAGVQVGKVVAIAIEQGRVRVDFYVTADTRVREDTVAEVRRTNLLGGVFLGLQFGASESPLLPPGSVVKSREVATVDQVIDHFDRNQERVLGGLADLIEESRDELSETIAHLESVVGKIDQGTGSLGRLVNDPALYDDVRQTTARLKVIAARLEEGEGTMGRLLVDPSLYEDAAAALANLKEISGRVKAGEGTVGRLFAEDRLYADAADALAHLRQITGKVNGGEGSLGKLVNDDALYEQTRGTMARINSITTKIDEGEGTLGQLVNDPSLYRDAKTTLNKVEKTVDGLGDTGPISALGTVLGTLF